MKAISVFSAAIVTISLGVYNVMAQNFLPNGTYQFVNRVLDPSGNQVALTSNGPGTTVVLSTFVHNQANQLWAVGSTSQGIEIAAFGTKGTVTAATSGTLPQILRSLTGAGIVWDTTNIDGSITISDTSNRFNWASFPSTPVSGSIVVVQSAVPVTSSAGTSQLWVPVLVSASTDL
ncbi:hypothetical protein Clacol_007087 [Clathrus columnatus]|uniref:CCL2-like lectin domain-containing protein n=1 Tax=Clathrus columnatus TaxID=1419009 RepID=A0AAV5ADY7_9AGAM|nr:hypothetical protein Clacol_007087 [Clathrus columnatus]